MIFPKYKLLFLHSGKTAGTAIEKMIEPNVVNMKYDVFNETFFYGGNGEVLTQHASAKYMMQKLPIKVWGTYFKFTVIRNPYERIHSVYHYNHDAHEKKYGKLDNFITALPDLIGTSHTWKGSHYLPQWEYASVNNIIVVDQIIRFEDINAGVNDLRKRFNITNNLTRYNLYTNPKRIKKPAVEIFNDNSIDIINQMYNKDFENFNYRKY